MPLVKATDIAFARLQVPDMGVAEQFLLDFGLKRAERTATALYMRGTDPDPFIYVAHLGDAPKFLSSAWHVASEDDLKPRRGCRARHRSKTWRGREVVARCPA